MITVDSPIVGKGGTVAEALTALDRPDDQDVAYVNELFRICQSRPLDFRIAFGQFCVETADGTSERWLTNRNPAGLAVTKDSDPDPAKFTGIEAARVHGFALYHATNRGDALNPLVPASALPFLQRWEAKYRDPNCPLVKTVADLSRHYTDSHGEQQATWAWDETYADQIVKKANAIFQESPDSGITPPVIPKETNSMPVYPVAGLPGPGIDLPVPLIQRILPISEFNRPGRKRQLPGFWVQHETDNYAPGADALMHANWLQGGPTDSEGNRQYVGFHFCVDDHQITQMIPIDEIGWHAADGAGPGNYSGIGCELCVCRGIDTAKARRNAEALAGGIMRALAMGADRIKRHYDFNAADPDRHHCPDTMMNDGYWDAHFVPNVGKTLQAAPANPPSSAPKPPSVPWDRSATGVHDLNGSHALAFYGAVTAKRDVPVWDHWGKGKKQIGTIAKGKTGLCRGTTRSGNTRLALVDLGAAGVGRAALSAFAEKWPVI